MKKDRKVTEEKREEEGSLSKTIFFFIDLPEV